jgi:hypothetical protein
MTETCDSCDRSGYHYRLTEVPGTGLQYCDDCLDEQCSPAEDEDDD